MSVATLKLMKSTDIHWSVFEILSLETFSNKWPNASEDNSSHYGDTGKKYIKF